MALALSIKTGGGVMVGGEEVRVTSVHGKNVSLVARGREFLVSELERKEVLPGVFISTAKSKRDHGRARIVFEAPKEIKITRIEEEDVQPQ